MRLDLSRLRRSRLVWPGWINLPDRVRPVVRVGTLKPLPCRIKLPRPLSASGSLRPFA